MSDLLIWSLENARRQTLNLVEDLHDEQMCLQSAAGENPPAWILGHLLLGDTYLLSMLKVWEFSADFTNLLRKYGPNSNSTATPADYNSKHFLVERLTETGLLRTGAVSQMKNLTQPTPDETLAQTQPTIGHHLQMLFFHEGHHCGQIAAWHKAQNLPAVKGIFAS
jgi:uncharacterized damage-inducible protein DinB